MSVIAINPRAIVFLSAIMLATLLMFGTLAFGDEKHKPQRGPEALQDVALGAITMKNPMMRARKFTMPPGHKTPTHRHDGPGIRYVLSGEITIYWKDGTKKTYGPGDTYFEGTGENHPAHEMSAANEGDKPVTVYLVDLHPGG